MQLKPYQEETLRVLRRFLEEARVGGPKNAYEAVTQEPAQAQRLGRYRGEYRALEELPSVPYVCLRLPTGGGKTLLAAHAIGVARDAWIEKDYPLVLWLVPSNTIRLQTVEALKNTRHPYRRALDDNFGGRVRVFDIADFTTVLPHDLRDKCCVVVGTIQTLRIGNTEGRKVYAHHEELETHFGAIPRTTPGLEPYEGAGGGPKFSFANLLHIHRPLMIVDEAHNAVTRLMAEVRERVNPCAIVEMTATPRESPGAARFKSNILHSVTAQELKDAEMIKLPIVLAEHESWQGAVNAAVSSRAGLEEAAKAESPYIRPIALFQAQPRNEEVTVEVLRKHLIETENVPPERIAVATGDQRELDGIDLFDPKCPIDHVITVEALKEGWDCSFAYVFCSVQRVGSATDIEQLLGRVLRMPYAARRAALALNRAYAHVSEPNFGAAARTLVDKLVAMGFEEEEAKEAIEPAQGSFDETALGQPQERPRPVFRHRLQATPKVAAALRAAASAQGFTLTETDGQLEIAVSGRVAPETEAAIAAVIPTRERPGFEEEVSRYRAETDDLLSPAEKGEAFVVPGLTVAVQGELQLADTDVLMEDHDWRLADHPARLEEGQFSIRSTARTFEIDIDGRHVTYGFANETEQLAFEGMVEGWTPQHLVLWLDRQLRQPDILQTDMVRWLTECVGHLTGLRNISINDLMRAKFILMRKLRDRIAAARADERTAVYQRCLFERGATIEVSFDNGFAFRDGMYADQRRYRGPFRFTKHFLGPEAVPAFDGAPDGEEFRCAQALDSLPQARFWVRNVARHPASFWLPTASGRFYPDFVARLTDGRLLVAEYKGELLAGPGVDDTNEKRAIGELWERRSAGKGLFLVVEKNAAGRDMRAQLLAKVAH
jgi:type III restriction enzyme